MRVEQYFELGNFSEEQKLQAVRICFDDEALTWYRWERGRNPFLNWSQMKQRVLEQFSTGEETSAGERLLTLRQGGTVKEYCREFIALATNAPEIQEAVLEMAFMNGLKPMIRARVKTFEPRHLKKMMSVAKRVEDWDLTAEDPAASNFAGGVRGHRMGQINLVGQNKLSGPRYVGGLAHTKAMLSSDKPTTMFRAQERRNTTLHNRVKPPFRRLTPTEIVQHKAVNLCFRCNESWHSRHQCPKKELHLLVVVEDGSEREWGEFEESYEEEEEQGLATVAELSLNSLVGISSPKTIKIKGAIQSEEVVVMIDSGATHNFISERLVRRLHLNTEKTEGYGVVIGTGITVQGQGMCKGIELRLQELTVKTSFLPLELGSADVILGMQWLETLGEMRVNWKLQWVKFKLAGQEVWLKGDPSLCCTPVSMKAMWKTLEQQGEGMIVEYAGLYTASDVSSSRPPEFLKGLLEEYHTVFAEPQGLPPSRGREHSINLDPGSKPVTVR